MYIQFMVTMISIETETTQTNSDDVLLLDSRAQTKRNMTTMALNFRN